MTTQTTPATPNKENKNPLAARQTKIKSLITGQATQARIMQLLGDQVKREKFSATLINVALDSALATCSPESIVKSGLQAAELDLSLNKNMGLAYIVRYKKDAEFQIGYKGWQLLAKRAGIRLNVTPIYDCDEFEISSDGFETTVKHIPNLDAQQHHLPEWVESHLRGVLVSTKEDGEISHKFVSVGKIQQIAGVSPSKKNGSYSPYSLWNLEMYMGKATKYVLSKMPMQEQLARAVEMENEVDKQRVAETQQPPKDDDILDVEFSTIVSDERFQMLKQNIINKEVTLQELCDQGNEFSQEQYAELEKLENTK
ncbi:recombinase RecT [Glaesserella parasuis]|uniref:recombinase RecT n=1 Tax=Glaesserella parasuis TaxID=738 RepID=UPI002437364F|nr:recombinase RecT [Glaesserella parasuis]MDG6359250.1 recombinase RecT [Glaesserella parasuis]